MKRAASILIALAALTTLGGTAQAQAQTATQTQGEAQVLRLSPIDENDRMLCGVFRAENYDRVKAIYDEFDAAMMNRARNAGQSAVAADRAALPAQTEADLAKLERDRAEALKSLDRLPAAQRETMTAQVNASFDRAKQSLLQSAAKAGADMNAAPQNTAPDLSPEALYALKRRLASLMVDGTLREWPQIRDFHHGRAAVKQSRGGKWGFIDGNLRLIVPFEYEEVEDFSNRSYGEDLDNRQWTTVRRRVDGRTRLGMVDHDGREVIPCRYAITHKLSMIQFYTTPWGELAPVGFPDLPDDRNTGLIDREGRVVVQPFCHHIRWDESRGVFLSMGKTGDPTEMTINR